LIEGYPFYILADKRDSDGDQMAIQVDPADQYAPRTTGVHNVFLAKFEGRGSPNIHQQFTWNTEEQSLRSVS
jgi:hypothetical protein